MNKTILPLILAMFMSCTNEIPVHKDVSKSFEERAKHIVSLLTLEEKVSQMSYESPEIKDWKYLHITGGMNVYTVLQERE